MITSTPGMKKLHEDFEVEASRHMDELHIFGGRSNLCSPRQLSLLQPGWQVLLAEEDPRATRRQLARNARVEEQAARLREIHASAVRPAHGRAHAERNRPDDRQIHILSGVESTIRTYSTKNSARHRIPQPHPSTFPHVGSRKQVGPARERIGAALSALEAKVVVDAQPSPRGGRRGRGRVGHGHSLLVDDHARAAEQCCLKLSRSFFVAKSRTCKLGNRYNVCTVTMLRTTV